jgi:hypothetical protein
LSIGLYIVLAPLYLKSVRKLQEKRFVFVKILAIIIPENGAKVSKIKCFQFAQQTLNREVIHRSASWKKLKLLETRRSLLTERGMQGVGIAEYFMKKRKGWLGINGK